MAKTSMVEFQYCDFDRQGPSSDGVLSSGALVEIRPDNEIDFQAVKELKEELSKNNPDDIQFSDATMVQVRGKNGGDIFRTIGAVGLSIEDNELIPFASKDAAKNIAAMINARSEQVRHRQ